VKRALAEIWTGWVRLLAVLFAALEIGVFNIPEGYESWAWALTVFFFVGAVVLLVLAYRASRSAWHTLGFAALAFDAAVAYGFVFVYAFEPGTIRQVIFVPLVEAAVRYGLLGGIAVPVFSAGALALYEWSRATRFDGVEYDLDNVTFPVGIQLIVGGVVGSLVNRLREERKSASDRAAEAEKLRD
jgi:hypothetical protein